jgi:hypothetical protein
MDSTQLDSLARALAGRARRRTIVRLLATGVVGALAGRFGATAAAQNTRPDRDSDGLFDDDELEVYGTNPDIYDTDEDGSGDGEEVYLGTDPLVPPAAGCPFGQTPCGNVCVDLLLDVANCGTCGNICPATYTCTAGACDQLVGPAPRVLTCAERGLTDCGGVCIDTEIDFDNCGGCGLVCAGNAACAGGACLAAPIPAGNCGIGTSPCNGQCVDLDSDEWNCGRCGYSCGLGTYCSGRQCRRL